MFHIHTYFDDKTEETARSLRNRLMVTFPNLKVGKFRDKPVGPHPKRMFQITVSKEEMGSVLLVVMKYHKNLSVLIHPCMNEDLLDHTERAMWLGDKVELNLDKL